MQERKSAEPKSHSELEKDELKKFQAEVATNPYAQALATPVRFCSLTLARLPSHFLLPFTTTIERSPSLTNGQPNVKARLQPGRSPDYTENTLAQTSYIVNRQDIVRHLSRKKHWTSLLTERQKAKLASIAHRSVSARGLTDYWAWDSKVDAMAAMLEKRVIDTLTSAVRASGKQDTSSTTSSAAIAIALALDEEGSRELELESHVDSDIMFYDLPALLSPETLQAIQDSIAPSSSSAVYISKSPRACQAQLALDKLKTYKESNEILKDLPRVQNPPGSREARLKRELEELGNRPTEEEEDGNSHIDSV